MFNKRGELTGPGKGGVVWTGKNVAREYALYSWKQTVDPLKAILNYSGESKKALEVQSAAQ